MNAETEMNGADGLGTEDAAERQADLERIADGHGEEYSNDELLRLGIGYGIPGPLSDEQMRREARERLAELDPLDELRRECGYSPDGEDEGVDALIDYKDALEDRLGTFEADLERVEAALTQVQHISHDGLVEIDRHRFGKGRRAVTMLEKIQSISEGGAADPEFVALLAAANRD